MDYSLNIPNIAVIIATKNRSDLLKNRSLSSVLKQSIKPDYIVVVDDSPIQAQLQNRLIVESLSLNGCQIQYLINQRTSGASGAWNTAIDYLSSKQTLGSDLLFLAFLDDDDEWHSNYLKSCLSVATKNNCNMVAASFYRYESDSQVPINCIPPNLISEDLFLRGNPGIQGSNLFLSLEIMLMAGSFDEQLSSCTDRDLCIRLCELEATRYTNIDTPLLNHYADNDRQRLSTPNSKAKNKGLTVFWNKYHSRMSNSQSEAFLERAQSLFNWHPQNVLKRTSKIALTLGVELGKISFTQLSQAIKKIIKVGHNNLTDFKIVLTTTNELERFSLHSFLDLMSKLEITCYNLYDQQVCIETATGLIAKENINYSAWVLKSGSIQEPLAGDNVVSVILTELGAYQLCNNNFNNPAPKSYFPLIKKIQQCRIEAANKCIKKLFDISDLLMLGIGSEAIVMTDKKRVFKYIDYWKTCIPDEQIKFLKSNCLQWHDLPGLYTLDEVISDGRTLVLTYPYEESTPYKGGNCEQVIDLLHSCSKAGFVCNNIHPKNLIKTQKEVKLIDYGSDIRPWNELGFEHMARRAYLTIYHAGNPRLNDLMRQSIHTTSFSEMQSYQLFRQRLIGIDQNLKQSLHLWFPLAQPNVPPKKFSLTIGVITGDAYKLLPLLNSIEEFTQCSFLSSISTIVLCNGCSDIYINTVLKNSRRPLGNVQIISETQQIEDAKSGLFGSDFEKRPTGQVGIAHARSMLQKYVGLKCTMKPGSFAWIIDDDMRLDARAKKYLAWLPAFKQSGVDVVIGQYEGSSPNPPLNGLRGQLVDLLHNLHWLDKLPNNIELPNRGSENALLRDKYPDYYYDLSRAHTAHIETPFWLEASYNSETVGEARARMITNAPLLVTGFPLTRSIIPKCATFPLEAAKDSVNRGGNTFILNPDALIQTPNLIPKINRREIRRSDMMWAIVNKHHHRLTIKSATFPVQHIGRVQNEQTLNLNKVLDEIMGSALYAGLQEFLQINIQHNLVFSDTEIHYVWQATKKACDTRLSRLKHSFYRINGLAQALTKYPELTALCEYLTKSFNTASFIKLENQVKQMDEQHIHMFLNKMVPQSTRFAKAHQETFEIIE